MCVYINDIDMLVIKRISRAKAEWMIHCLLFENVVERITTRNLSRKLIEIVQGKACQWFYKRSGIWTHDLIFRSAIKHRLKNKILWLLSPSSHTSQRGVKPRGDTWSLNTQRISRLLHLRLLHLQLLSSSPSSLHLSIYSQSLLYSQSISPSLYIHNIT